MEQQTQGEQTVIEGQPASPGLARGPLWRYRRASHTLSDERLEEPQVQDHLERWEEARSQVGEELERMKREKSDPDTLAILEAQVQVARDPDLDGRIRREIRERLRPADRAIHAVFQAYLQAMNARSEGEDGRSVDLEDIRDRLIAQVQDREEEDFEVEEGAVVLARELSAREVIRLSGRRIRAIVTERGGAHSHAAIIARSMGIPTVMGAGQALAGGADGTLALVDGEEGTVVLHPGEEALQRYKEKCEAFDRRREARAQLCRRPSETDDGHPFALRANVEFPEELEKVRLFCAEGIGLLRTESVYLERSNFDDLAMQEEFYDGMLEQTGEHPVTIRLFDAGGDKFFRGGEPEDNPFLGWRGIRMLLDERQLLRDQLEAVLRVAGRYPGRVRLLLPMVTETSEVREVREEISRLHDRLEEEGADVDRNIQLGIMIEVPAVALQAHHFTGLVDFFSLGTNDLTQYLLAVDRGNDRVSRLYDQRHPAVWRTIKRCAEAAREGDTSVAICGELASDPVAAACLLGMGVDDLSMSPSRIPEVKELLTERTHNEMEELADRALASETAGEIHRLFKSWKEKHDG
ncbi:MAG: phosphoenolpyruvate--protein phosphotransferase [Balneolaceae bacterium]|nr:phosphoenolpyruvate--protein phosphotransferase [Balneolaceae bacterium]